MLVQERLEVIRRAHEALDRGDWDAISTHLTADVVLDDTRARGPQQGVYRGIDEVRGLWTQMAGVFDSVRVEVGDMTPIGDVVVVPRRFVAQGRDDIEVIARSFWLMAFEGDRISWICLYQEEQEAIDAAQARQQQ